MPVVNMFKEATTELDAASLSLRQAYNTWSHALSNMHMAEIGLRDAQRRMARTSALLQMAANNPEDEA